MKKQISTLEAWEHLKSDANNFVIDRTGHKMQMSISGQLYWLRTNKPCPNQLSYYDPFYIEVPDEPAETNKQIAERAYGTSNNWQSIINNILDAVDTKDAALLARIEHMIKEGE